MREYNHLSFLDQVNLFELRGMTIEDKGKAEQKLRFISYYKLKELAYPFYIKKEGEMQYTNISFDTLIKRYYQDKRLRTSILYCLEKIEVAFKTRFGYQLGNRHGAYGYLNFSNWCNKEEYCKHYISEKQGVFKKDLKDKAHLYKNRCIDDHFNKNPELNKDPTKIPIWMLVEVMTFGEVLQLYKLMSNKNRESISNEFKCTPTELESWLNGLKFARNKCAHNANVIDLKLKTKTKLRNEWKKYIYIETKNNQSTGGLSDIIIPMVHLTTIINESFQFNEIQKAINTIVDRDDESAIKFGFANAHASVHAISDMGGHFKQNYNSKQTKNRL